VHASKIDGMRFRLVASADCKPAVVEIRAVNRLGITNARPFVVGGLPVVLEADKNSQPGSAMPLETPCVVHGHADAEQRDYYKIRGHGGEPLHITCTAFHLDSPMDPVITVVDPTGRTLQRGDDECDRDASFTWEPPGDGDFFVEVHDKTFGGGAAHAYRLSITRAGPRDGLFDDAQSGREDATLPCRQVAETEPNNDRETAQAIETPVVVTGRFDDDYFVFDADPAQPLWIDVTCTGSSDGGADPLVVIEKVSKNANGEEQSKQVLELDDQNDLPTPPFWQSGSRNPSGKFVPDEKARYRLLLRDRFGAHGEYRLLLTRAEPDFSVIALGECPANEEKKIFRWQPNARRDGSAYFHVAARRRNYDGEITLGAFGLPEGLHASGAIPAGTSMGVLTFHADANAKPWAGLFRVFADGGGVMREAQCMSYRWPVDSRDNQRLAPRTGGFAIGIADEPAPISIRVAEATTRWESAIGAKLEIPLQFAFPSAEIRAKGEWQIVPIGLTGLKKVEPLKFDAATAKDAKLVLNFQKEGNAFQPGTFTFWPRASGTVAYKENPTAKPRDLKHVEYGGPIQIHLSEGQAATAPK
jgi:hypothetical protein